eukprot:Seg3512.2 transcript_id=Seg3512.2/GoldUCD/mRNA.D3Y31 product="hypothetical protein" pseudo=true protein_id=Seg3512.2/GoldUCD/D3Y31
MPRLSHRLFKLGETMKASLPRWCSQFRGTAQGLLASEDDENSHEGLLVDLYGDHAFTLCSKAISGNKEMTYKDFERAA